MISTEKQILRVAVLKAVRAMSPGERQECSAAVAAHLGCLSGVVLGFAPMRLEPDWTPAIREDWLLALPRVEGDGLFFREVRDWSGLERGGFGVREPATGEVVNPSQANVVLIPGVAFDRTGARLGRGGGFYDRLLADPALTARRVAVCFSCQLVGRVPVEAHDARVEAIVTESGWIDVRNSGFGRD